MNNESGASFLRIETLEAGTDYLGQLQLANPTVAETQLIRFLDALLTDPPAARILFSLLEQARAPLSFIGEEMAKRFQNKPLVLSDAEEMAFRRVVGIWERLAKAYALCASMESPNIENPQYASMVATILHRCIYYNGMLALEHYRARRELPAGIWLDLHGYYESAEEWGVAYLPVEDGLENSVQATHCAAAYVALLLVDLASPYSNSVRNLNLIRRWAGMWAPLVAVLPLKNHLELPPYIVELMKDLPLHPSAMTEDPDEDARSLDTSSLGLQIGHTLGQLRQRIPPSRLGLGDETGEHVIRLLERISRPWMQMASPRRFRRFASKGVAKVATGFEAMHFSITQAEFEQPASANGYTRRDFDQLFTFRDQVDSSQPLTIKPPVVFPFDEWSVINHSASGFRLARSREGQKLAHGQLLAVCPHDGDCFLLANVVWLMQEESGGLIAGLETLPGMPTGIGIRQGVESGIANNDDFVRAFMLPPLPAISEQASLVLPPGYYKGGGLLDLYHGEETYRVRMLHILHRGQDFDRISYERP